MLVLSYGHNKLAGQFIFKANSGQDLCQDSTLILLT
jgi:hypothetical protein